MNNKKFEPAKTVVLTDENGLKYHAHNFSPFEPLYENRFIHLWPFSLGDLTVAGDVDGEFVINKKGENILGAARYKFINHYRIVKCDEDKSTQEFDMFTGKIGTRGYLFLFNDGKWHTVQFGLKAIIPDMCIYYPHFNLVDICYVKGYPRINMCNKTQILLDLNTKKRVGVRSNANTLVRIRNCEECVELFEFREKISYSKSNYYYGLASENFKHMYRSKEDAMKAVLSFDYLNKDETIQL